MIKVGKVVIAGNKCKVGEVGNEVTLNKEVNVFKAVVGKVVKVH